MFNKILIFSGLRLLPIESLGPNSKDLTNRSAGFRDIFRKQTDSKVYIGHTDVARIGVYEYKDRVSI